MLFNSIHFLIFLPLVTAVYFALPLRPRRIFLLAASFYFYCVFSIPLSLLLVWSTLLDYTASRIIQASRRAAVRKAALITSIVGNLGMLAVFKYLDFFNHSLHSLLGFAPWPELNLILPMGISFYTFQTMAYTIDVYRGDLKASRSILDVALYVSFFPQLVAGPIMRGTTLLPQFHEEHRFNSERVFSGALLCLWGLVKKICVADPMGRIVDAVYGTEVFPRDPAAFSGFALLLATYAFAIQIYCDFSAYSDIARGAGRILGFRIMENFRAPYLAVTIREFWRRWHISLSTWLRDYLYIPLGGSRVSRTRTYVNLFITMLLGGLWHGANWTFVIWGGLHGIYLAVERMLGVDRLDRSRMSAVEQWARGIVTFHLVCLAWVFFRAPSAAYAFEVIARIVSGASGATITPAPLIVLVLLILGHLLTRRVDFHALALRRPHLTRWVSYACLAVIVRALVGGPSPEFIYFQF
ncbi:MAG: MBOAT family protein [Planctomycetota bacterium]|nr:MAG: MBOAT family protein [Planctomycetota bacterium]